MAYIFGGETGESIESLKRKRELAQRMLMARGAPRDIGEGLTAIGQAIAGRIAQSKLDKQQAAGMAKNREMLVGLLSGAKQQMTPSEAYSGPNADIDTPGSAKTAVAKKPIELGTDDLKAARTRGEPLDPVDIPGSARTAANPLAAGIVETAQALGVDPQDLATAISYETAGTFDPMKRGPTTQWGQHKGLIQFGQPQAKKYGVDWNNPIESQLGADGAIAKYLRDTGVKPGMGLLDIYSAINAGGVGRYNRTDANNGGAPGTVRDKVEKQMAGHRKKAAALLAQRSQPNSRQATLPTFRPDTGGMVAQVPAQQQQANSVGGQADRVSYLSELYGISPEQAQAMITGGQTQSAPQPVQVASLGGGEGMPLPDRGILVSPPEGYGQQAPQEFLQSGALPNTQIAPQFLVGPETQVSQQQQQAAPSTLQPVGRTLPGMPPVQQDMQRVQPSSETILEQAGQQTAPQAAPDRQLAASQQVVQAMPQPGQGGPGVNRDGFMVGVPQARPDPQAMDNAKSLAQSAGLDPRWIDIAQSPYATPAMRQLAIQQIQNRIEQMNPNEMQRLQLEKARLEVEAMKAPQPQQPPKVVELFDEKTGLPYKAVFNPQTGQFERVGGVKAPSGTQLSVGPDGSVQFSQGAGLKPLTESQSKDAVYATRAEGALATINQFDTELVSPGGHIAAKFGAFGNYFQTEGYQKAAQAGKEFLQAVLRKDTGAAITADEVREYGSVYLPMPGDSEAVIQQKRVSRQRALEAMKAGMPPAAILAQEKALARTQNAPVESAPAEPVPPGIDPEDWRYMTPEERRLFQ